MRRTAKAKILYIGPIPLEVGGLTAGGVETHLWDLATEASKRGHRIHVLATNATFSCVRDDIEVIGMTGNILSKAFRGLRFYLTADRNTIGFLGFLGLKRRISVLYRAFFLRQILKSVNPDLIHVHSIANTAILALKLLHSTTPLIATDHGFWQRVKNEEDRAIVAENLNYVNHLVCVSRSTTELLWVFGLTYGGKSTIIPNLLHTDKLSLLDRDKSKRELKLDNKKVVLFVGKEAKRKGIDILFRAFYRSDWLRNNCQLVIISNMNQLSKEERQGYVRSLNQESGISGRFVGQLPWSDELINYYNAADVFVVPSRSEAFAIVYIEALLAGTPIVGFHKVVREIEELVDAYVGEGFDASTENEQALADKIIKVLNTEFDRELLRQKVVDNLSWDARFRDYDSLYKEILG